MVEGRARRAENRAFSLSDQLGWTPIGLDHDVGRWIVADSSHPRGARLGGRGSIFAFSWTRPSRVIKLTFPSRGRGARFGKGAERRSAREDTHHVAISECGVREGRGPGVEGSA